MLDHIDHMVRSTRDNRNIGVHYTDVEERNRTYAHYVAAYQEPTAYRCPQRDKHEHPAPKALPAQPLWKCACGTPFFLFDVMMNHVITSPGDRHYPL